MSAVTRPAAESRVSLIRFGLGAAAAVLALVSFVPVFFGLFRPADPYRDFSQEWLSARNFWVGEPVYSPQRAAMVRLGEDPALRARLGTPEVLAEVRSAYTRPDG